MDIERINSLLSSSKTAPYKNNFDLSEKDKIGVFLAFQDISGSFYPVVSITEVALRNAINEAATEKFQKMDWYDHVDLSKESKRQIDMAKNNAKDEIKKDQLSQMVLSVD
ncbi:hypothetical protein LGZ99_02955 [Photorhabdus temperata]|uniref:Abi-like protein n=1 Tax=Photorhabdus temperata subsp. temperata Meg1 TaxID=1393735 RepID=A0A081RU34_PHOTE|nr:hypothetical protein [Photorhabdus temperata]KER02187.1 Abi-like protein [Photorhabdus temperata subsp. temperata Meg1]MCT8346198.1 hypothetical protein [Photorhabdus temperata]